MEAATQPERADDICCKILIISERRVEEYIYAV